MEEKLGRVQRKKAGYIMERDKSTTQKKYSVLIVYYLLLFAIFIFTLVVYFKFLY